MTAFANGTVKFPVICLRCEDAAVDLRILDALLETHRLILVANKADLSECLTSNDRPIDGVHTGFTTPFATIVPKGLEPMSTFSAACKTKEGVSSKAFVVLDRQTAKDGQTCQVTTHDDDSDGENYLDRVLFRCELSSALAALEILEQGPDETDQYRHRTARALRNEAAIAGGVWSREASESQRARVLRITVDEYPRSSDWNDWNEEGDLGSTTVVDLDDPRPYVAVFRTGDIGLETINSFLQQANNEYTQGAYTMALITSLEYPFHNGPARETPPLLSRPVLPTLLLGASPQECDILTRHLFPPVGKSDLHYNRFMVMDERTEKTETVLLACNCEFGGELQLLRCDFEGALLVLLSPESTILTMDSLASEAAEESDGVYRS